MGFNLADIAYQNLNALVENIHGKVYRGQNDRNRYRLNNHIYVWWEKGKVVKLLDTLRHQEIDFKEKSPQVKNNVNSFGNFGFYFQAESLLIDAIKATQPARTVEVREKTNQLPLILTSNTNTLLDVFA